MKSIAELLAEFRQSEPERECESERAQVATMQGAGVRVPVNVIVAPKPTARLPGQRELFGA